MSLTAYHYIIALVPFLIATVLWLTSSKIVWWEWLLSAGVSLFIAGTLHYVGLRYMVSDKETFSGQVLEIRNIPEWREKYKVTVTRKSGKSSYTTTETRHRTHEEKWVANTTLGDIDMNKQLFLQWSQTWGGSKAVPGVRETSRRSSEHVGGDPMDYIAKWSPDYKLLPCTSLHSWENRVKASPSKFDFQIINSEKARSYGLFDWPENTNPFSSDRK
jgi:hypothetical protein